MAGYYTSNGWKEPVRGFALVDVNTRAAYSLRPKAGYGGWPMPAFTPDSKTVVGMVYVMKSKPLVDRVSPVDVNMPVDQLCAWDVQTRKEMIIRTFDDMYDIRQMVLSPDGKTVAIVGTDKIPGRNLPANSDSVRLITLPPKP